MTAVGALDARLRLIAMGFRLRQGFPDRCEVSLDFVGPLFGEGDGCAQALETMLALDHTGVMIRAPADTQPVFADPLATSRDDRLARRQRASGLQGLGQRFRSEHTGKGPNDRSGPAHLRRKRLP